MMFFFIKIKLLKNEFKEFKQMRASQQGHQIEEVGARLREMMPFVKPNN